jgi:hypothetical protein
MVATEARLQKAIEDITDNESLMEMLDEEAAIEMLDWGKSTVAALVNQTDGLDDAAAEAELDQRLKAVRQFMRSAGNWAAGKYSDPADRVPLREKLLGYMKAIYGENAHFPSIEKMDAVLNQTDVQQNSQKQLVSNLIELFNEAA